MSKILRFRTRETREQAVREQACLWVVRLSREASDADLRDMRAWLRQSPEHVQALLEAAAVWDRVSVLAELSDIFPLAQYVSPRPVAWKRIALGAVAACVLLFCLHFQAPLLSLAENVWSTDHSEPIPLSYETRIGERLTVQLPDGSEVILNTNTRIEVHFTGDVRDIFLRQGEGHFTVVKDPAGRPFRVHANGGMVEAVGTAFSVQQSVDQGLEVTVLEGVVNFTRTQQGEGMAAQASGGSPGDEPAESEALPLSAGEVVAVDKDDQEVQKIRVQPNELESRLAWRHGMLLFQGDPLSRVVEEISRYTSIRIEVDEAVRDIQVLGYFRTGDIEGILLTMQDTFHINVERLSDEHIVLKSSDQR